MAKSLIRDPHNANQGTERGRALIRRSLEQYGAGRSILVDKNGVIIAGNKTFSAAELQKMPLREVETDGKELVVVRRTDLDLEADPKAKELAIADNRTTELDLFWDSEEIKELSENPEIDLDQFWDEGELGELLGEDSNSSGEMLDYSFTDEDPNDEEASKEDDQISIYAYRPDAVFPSKSNDWDIPDLRADRLSDQIPREVWAGQEIENSQDMLFLWGTNTFPPEARGGVLGFYVDDKRFVTVWMEAIAILTKLAGFGWGAVLGPDFSLWRNWPLAIQFFNLYRSRWCSRYWQEAGIPLIPSLNWSDERTYDWAFKGIPQGAPLVAVQCRTLANEIDQKYFLQGIAEGIRQIEPQKIIIYGGADHREWLAPHIDNLADIYWMESWTTVRRRIRFSKSRIEGGEAHEETKS